MPRPPGPINNEFIPIISAGKCPLVQCRHCKTHRVAKASSKRKTAHLRTCVPYLRSLNNQYQISNGDEDADGAEEETGLDGQESVGRVHDVFEATRRTVIKTSNGTGVWPFDAGLAAGNVAVLGTGLQEGFRDILAPAVGGINSLFGAARQAGVQIYHLRLGHRADLSTLFPRDRVRGTGPVLVRGSEGHEGLFGLGIGEGEQVVDHALDDAFAYSELELLLRVRTVRNLIFVGRGRGVLETVRGALGRGFDCLVVEEGVVGIEGREFVTARLKDVVHVVEGLRVRNVKQELDAATRKAEKAIGRLPGRDELHEEMVSQNEVNEDLVSDDELHEDDVVMIPG